MFEAKIKKLIIKIVHYCFPQSLYKKVSYSQDGEDMMIQTYYETKKKYKGFYVDVGAHHPYRFSNTAYFYKKGWRGINIEPSPALYCSFQKRRRRDINLNIGVSSNKASIPFYIFNDQALNTFDEKLAQERDSNNDRYEIISKVEIQTYPLRDILEKHLPDNQSIDFLTIDAEGLDLEVLLSNDWIKFQPEFILVECDMDLENVNQGKIYKFLKEKNYNITGKTKRTCLFRRN